MGARGEPSLSFEQDARPILKTHCFHCHGEGEKLKGGVDLRLRRFMADKTVDAGRVLTPGEPEKSLILTLARSGEMPKGEKKLSVAEIATLERWIAQGAPTLRAEPESLGRGFHITEEERAFWSFQPVSDPKPPAGVAGAATPIDAFLLQRARPRGLAFAPEADRTSLIKRLFIDLTGMIPSPEQVDGFLADKSPDAYERLADRLLASPRFGERWARHWLDVAGYADSNGYAEADSPRSHAWRYRDYVIESMNADKPWDQFYQEQLAGDEIAGATHETVAERAKDPAARALLTATGFLRMGPDGTGDDVPDHALAKNQVMAETIKIATSAMLGLTVGCAECHDHRYDPISQVDYYRLRAIFEPGYDWKRWRSPGQRLVSLQTEEDRKKAEAIEAEARKIDESANRMRKEFLEQVFQRELARLPEELRETVKVARSTPREKRTPEQVALFKKYPSADVQGALDLYDPALQKKVEAEAAKAGALRATKPEEPMIMCFTETAEPAPDTFVFARGDYQQPKDKVTPNELEILRPEQFQRVALGLERKSDSSAKPKAGETSGRRLSYARWLTSGRHPLTTRVLANRFWMHHFGRGLVNTPGDFGKLGERPTHPDLLDWLAQEIVRQGWRAKPLHRMIVTSAAYRQTSSHADSQETDPENKLIMRWKLRRMDAETVRDGVLAASGQLNGAFFGPPSPTAQDGVGRVVAGRQLRDGRGDPTIVGPIGEQAFRRGIYMERRRSLPLTVLDVFDDPVMSPNCEARNSSTVAPQALLALNDSFFAEQARSFAERLRRESPGDLRGQLSLAWRLVFGVAPNDEELRDGLAYVAEQTETLRARPSAPSKDAKAPAEEPSLQALASLCQTLLGSNRFLYVD